MKTQSTIVISLTVSLILSACSGGGGSGETFAPAPIPEPTPVNFYLNDPFSDRQVVVGQDYKVEAKLESVQISKTISSDYTVEAGVK